MLVTWSVLFLKARSTQFASHNPPAFRPVNLSNLQQTHLIYVFNWEQEQSGELRVGPSVQQEIQQPQDSTGRPGFRL